MKYLKLKFESGKIIGKTSKNKLGDNRFFHPINKMHVYNSFCCLLGRTPKPQLRETNDLYMPFFNDVMDVVEKGYIQIKIISINEILTVVKKSWNSNATVAKFYTWKDCSYVIGNLKPILIFKLSKILNLDEKKISDTPFDSIIDMVRELGVKQQDSTIVFHDEKVLELLRWLRLNSSTGISNYIENKQISSRPSQFGKRVYRGVSEVNKYSGLIYIPLTDLLYKELITYTNGFSTILDGGLVTILGYDYLLEDEIDGFTKISELNNLRKFDKQTTNVEWDHTIYSQIKPETFLDDIKKIILDAGILIDDSDEFKRFFDNISKVKFNGNNVGEIGYKVNNFVEKKILEKYK